MRSPFGVMRRFMEEMDRMMEGFGMGRGMPSNMLAPFESMGAETAMWMPDIEVMERDGKLEIRADLPGMKAEDVKVDVEDEVLTISGERQHHQEGTEGGVFHSERSYGSFSRSIALPQGVDPGAIEARFEDGVLEITLPMPQRQTAGRKIDVRSGPARSGGGSSKVS